MIRPLVVYVAGPYSSDPEYNTKVAMDFGSALIAEGVAPIVPHLNHYMHLRVPQEYETWMSVDFTLIRRCNLLVRLPGHSPGADREVAFALGARIPVVEVAPVGFNDVVPQNVKDEIARLTKESNPWF